jgi:S1-C subfamily serine protease/tetratricopeptide (TPR) repeat protein
MFTMRMALAVLVVLGIGNAARGDVVILKNGNRLEGIVTPTPGKPDSILVRNYKTRLTIQRDRISSIQEEPDSVDWRRIGDQFFKERRYEEALETYKKSASLDPADTKTAEQIRATELALQHDAPPELNKQVKNIVRLLDEAAQKTDRKEYEAAESILLENAPALTPSADQQKRILDLKKALYKKWALELEDKLCANDAGKCFEKLLALDPLDKDANDRLIVIWEKQPEKTPQVIEAYKSRLAQNSGDTATRRKLADKYMEYAKILQTDKSDIPDRARRVDTLHESAVEHYETLVDGKESPHPDIADAVSNCLTSLYTHAEWRRDYDQAIAYYRRLQKYSKKAGDDVVYTMEYRRDFLKIGPKNADALTTLALRADKQGLVDLARTEIWSLKNRFPNNACVNHAMAMYAARDLADAEGALRTLQYGRADAMAGKVAVQYSFIPDVAQRAAQIQSQARIGSNILTRSKENAPFKVMQSLPAGALCVFGEVKTYPALGIVETYYTGETFYLSGTQNRVGGNTVVDDEELSANLYWGGTYTYTTVRDTERTVNLYCLSLPEAMKALQTLHAPEPPRKVAPRPGPKASGSGFLVTKDGFLLTNHHVVDGAARVVVVVSEKERKEVRIVGEDRENDLALLKIEGEFSPVSFAQEEEAQVGQDLFAVGFPNPDIQGFSPKATKGIISSQKGSQDEPNNYQIDAAIQPGNSGGPVVDEHGNVIGVAVSSLNQKWMIARDRPIPQNVNYAIKKSCVLNFLRNYPQAYRNLVAASGAGNLPSVEALKKVSQSTVLLLVY